MLITMSIKLICDEMNKFNILVGTIKAGGSQTTTITGPSSQRQLKSHKAHKPLILLTYMINKRKRVIHMIVRNI
jgi:hypothetical protein